MHAHNQNAVPPSFLGNPFATYFAIELPVRSHTLPAVTAHAGMLACACLQTRQMLLGCFDCLLCVHMLEALCLCSLKVEESQ